MKPIYRQLMMLSQDFLDVYKYILNGSMKEKDYATSLKNLGEILEGVKWVKPNLEKHRGFEDYDVFSDHLRHIEFVVSRMITIVEGLQSKANRTSKYGVFKYRKDQKSLNESYKLFELSGNYLNSESEKYLTS